MAGDKWLCGRGRARRGAGRGGARLSSGWVRRGWGVWVWGYMDIIRLRLCLVCESGRLGARLVSFVFVFAASVCARWGERGAMAGVFYHMCAGVSVQYR